MICPVRRSTFAEPGSFSNSPRSGFASTSASRNISPDSGSEEFCVRRNTEPVNGSSSNGVLAVTVPIFEASEHPTASSVPSPSWLSEHASSPSALPG